MKRKLCSIYLGDEEASWFAPMHVVYLCLQFAGLVGSGQRSSYFVLYCSLRLARRASRTDASWRWRMRKSRFLLPKL